MNRPCTSWPARLSSRAVTAESTPPESATMMRSAIAATPSGAGGQRLRGEVAERCEVVAPARKMVVDAIQHQGAAQARRMGQQRRARHPVRGDDALIQRAGGIVAQHLTAQRHAQDGMTVGRIAPQVQAEQVTRHEMPGGLLQGFAYRGFDQRFAILDVAGWLVEYQRALDAFFDDEELVFALHDGSDSQV